MQCNNCSHESVCKYESDYKEISEKYGNTVIMKFPFKFSLVCNMFTLKYINSFLTSNLTYNYGTGKINNPFVVTCGITNETIDGDILK